MATTSTFDILAANYLQSVSGPFYLLGDVQMNTGDFTIGDGRLQASSDGNDQEHILITNGADGVLIMQNTDTAYYSGAIMRNDGGFKVGAIALGNSASDTALRDRLFLHGNTDGAGAFATIPPIVDIGQDFNYSAGGYRGHTYIACIGGNSSAFGTAFYGLSGASSVGTLAMWVDGATASVTIGGSTAVTNSKLAVNGNVALNNGSANTIFYGQNGLAAPADSGAGQKIQLYGVAGTVDSTDYAIGVEGGFIWMAAEGGGFKFYNTSGGNTLVFTISSAGLITTSSTTLHATSAALGNGAGAGGGTLTNAPTAGNPTKWVPINDNGTTRYIPTWT